MATALKLRRGTTAQHSTFTGAEGEVTVDTTKDTLVVHDNATAGGFPVVTETGTQTLTNKALNGTLGATTPSTVVATSVTVSAGTAGAPAITTTGDTNTGIFFPAADTIAFSEGGTESMRIDASGNVGVGVTPNTWSLGKAMEVNSGGNALWSAGPADIRLTAGAYYNGAYKYGNTGSNAAAYEIAGGTHVWRYSGGGTINNNISFTQAMTLDASGNLGIGTAIPAYKLDVTGQSSLNGIRIGLNGDTINGSSGLLAFQTSGIERMRLDSSGNLQFNSGYGYFATAYGCRAWVNFNGTGTVAIRASGNVSSITDNGTGNYTINFTNAMPDINYATTVNTQGSSTGSIVGEWGLYTQATNAFNTPTTSAFRITTWNSAVSGLADTAYVMATVFR